MNKLGATNFGRDTYLTTAEAGQRVGKSAEAFRVWAKRRRLELRRVDGGRQLFIRVCDLDAALERVR
jgi:GH24 family phage-related lysozyme (muramidase)